MKIHNYLLLICVIFASLFCPVTAFSQETVAVYVTGNGADESQKKYIETKLVEAIINTRQYQAVERTADFMSVLSKEMDFQLSGEVPVDRITAVGQKFGVERVIVANVGMLYGDLFVTSRLINIRSGSVEKQASTSGSAQNINELSELSRQIAYDLLGQRLALNYSTLPINLSLCVRKDGMTYYLTRSQWVELDVNARSAFKKIGIYIDCSSPFILELFDSGSSDHSRAGNTPSKDQFQAIYNYSGTINSLLYIFGGELMSGYYWCSTIAPHKKAWRIDLKNGQFRQHDNTAYYKIRNIIR